MRSHEEGSLSAAMQVKVSSPEIIHIATGQRFHFLETNNRTCAKGERETDVPGSKSAAGKRIEYVGTCGNPSLWEENRITPRRSFRGAGKATRKYDDSVVGLTHSRGKDRVMPAETQDKEKLEGVSRITQRDEDSHAIH